MRSGVDDRDAAGERQVALAAEQALARHVGGDQRGRAGGLHRGARPPEVELVGDAGGEEVAVVEQHHLEAAQPLERRGLGSRLFSR